VWICHPDENRDPVNIKIDLAGFLLSQE